MNKTQKRYIVLVVFACLSSYTFAGDILESYINMFMSNPVVTDDNLLALLGDPGTQVQSLPDKSKQEAVPPEKVIEAKVAETKQAGLAKESPVTKPAPDVVKSSFAGLDKTRDLREKLKDSSIMSLPDGSNSSINSQLKDVLQQLHSLSFSDQTKTIQQDIKIMPEPERVVLKVDLKAVESEPNEVISSSQDDQPILNLPENTSEIVDMFELAESLFHIGDKVSALKYYRKALKKSLPVGKKANPRRAWILFQIGNCLYNADKVAAIKVYEQLILEHPSSEWTNCARTKKQILKWILVEKPMKLTMTEVK